MENENLLCDLQNIANRLKLRMKQLKKNMDDYHIDNRHIDFQITNAKYTSFALVVDELRPLLKNHEGQNVKHICEHSAENLEAAFGGGVLCMACKKLIEIN
jgi:hypothetical protein